MLDEISHRGLAKSFLDAGELELPHLEVAIHRLVQQVAAVAPIALGASVELLHLAGIHPEGDGLRIIFSGTLGSVRRGEGRNEQNKKTAHGINPKQSPYAKKELLPRQPVSFKRCRDNIETRDLETNKNATPRRSIQSTSMSPILIMPRIFGKWSPRTGEDRDRVEYVEKVESCDIKASQRS
jgi:hypothetical protein